MIFRSALLHGVLVAVLCLSAHAAAPPAAPAADYPVLSALERGDGAAWAPMNETAAASAGEAGGRVIWHMPCNFSGTDFERASWTRAAALDLSGVRGLRFQMYCADPSPVLEFTLYLRSGSGWFTMPFFVEAGRWTEIRADRCDMGREGAPNGWNAIDAVRIGAWRLASADTEFHVTGFGTIPAESPIVLLLGDYAAVRNPGDAAAIRDQAQTLAHFLDDLGLPFTPLSDVDLSSKRLAGKKLVILPFNPVLPAAASKALADFSGKGGKLITFYAIPAPLQSLMGIQQGKAVPQSRPGQYASIRRSGGALPGLPAVAAQASAIVADAAPVKKRAQVAAMWCDEQGASTGKAAILASRQGIHMTHVLLKDDPANKRLLLLAMIEHAVPGSAAVAAAWQTGQGNALGPYSSCDAAAGGLAGAGSARVKQLLADAAGARARAQQALKKEENLDAAAMAIEARERFVDAYCAAQAPKQKERRLFWCHDAYGVSGLPWDEAIKRLAAHGFTDVIPNMLWGGCAYYPSEVLPTSWLVKERGDALAACTAACKQYGIKCHVWKVCWNLGGNAPAALRQRMKSEGRTQVRADGSAKDDWLCPSHPANQKLEIDALIEVLRKYDVAGLHLDYIRYPDARACYCPGCRERFEKGLGKKVASWPGGIEKDDALRAKWLEFRRAQITTVVGAVSAAARTLRPKVEISAAVYMNWPQHRDTIGQDWRTWCEKGYLDFVCPMDYTPWNGQFENIVKQQMAWRGKAALYPGIGLSTWPGGPDAVRLIDQIGITRRLNTGGFAVFNYRSEEARSILPRLALGVTKP